MKYIFTFLSFFFLAFMSMAQSDSKYVKQADDVYDFGAKEDAQQLYMLALEENPNNIKANFMSGVIYIETIHKPRGLKYFLKAFEIDAKYNPSLINQDYKQSLLYYIGSSYHYSHDFENAINYYKRYKGNLDLDFTTKRLSKEVYDVENTDIERRLFECMNGKDFIANPVDVKIENLGDQINTPYGDYTPVVSADEKVLVFTSRRPGGTSDDVHTDNKYYEDVYISHKQGDNWGQAENIGTVINTETFDATSSLSSDGKILYIYNDEKGGTLYSSTFEEESNGEWGTLKIIPQLKSKSSHETHVTTTADGKKMIFTSDRDGGLGDLDMWMAEQDDNGKWLEPVNLGETLNTPYEERGPFILADGSAMYFSSQGHKGMGGHDIFRTDWDEDKKEWSEPENIGYPINTADDDVYISYTGDGRRGYYASIKDEGLGDKDIYVLYLPEPEIIDTVEKIDTPVVVAKKAPSLKPVTLRGIITDASTGEPISAELEIRNSSDNSVVTVINTGNDGTYRYTFSNSKELEYQLNAQKPGYIYSNATAVIPAMDTIAQEVERNLALQKAVVGKKVIIRNIYYHFDKYSLKSESYAELDKIEKLLNENPNMKLEISGHTDKIGSLAYNVVLGKRRAKAVVKFLVNKGISSDRLISKGYGETKPLVSNDDETDGREINRRTEFIILEK